VIEQYMHFVKLMRMSALYYIHTLDFIVIVYWNSRPQEDMSLHSDILFWFRAKQFLFLLLMLCA